MFDELKIMITGDVSGIDKSIKQAFNIVQGGVSKMNDQEVDWTSIFARAVSPAIISGVATMFAFAISQAVQFQQAMAETGTSAGMNTAQISQMSDAALNMSKTLPNSAQDLATTMTQVSAVFGTNTQATNDITNAIAELSDSGFGSLNDITSTAMETFRQFGVTTEAGAIQVLTDLMHAAQGAKETIPVLGDQFNNFAQQLPVTDKNLSSINGMLSTFAGEIQAIGPTEAGQIFDALAKAAQGAAPQMEAVGLGAGKVNKSLQTDGGLSAIDTASTILQQMGPNAALVATNLGLSAGQVEAFQLNSTKLPQIAIDAKTIGTNGMTIKDAFDQSKTSLEELQILWDHFKGDAIQIGDLFAPMVKKFLSDIDDMLTGADNFFTSVKGGWNTLMGDMSGKSTFDQIKTAFSDVGTGISEAFKDTFGGGNTQLDQALTHVGGSGVIFDNATLAKIDQQASQQGIVNSLISALQTGIKPGQYGQTVQTFNLTVPNTQQGLTAQDIARQLYQKFQGTQ